MIASTLLVDVVRDIDGFAALEAEWSELSERAERSSVFMTWEWQFLWWKHYGGSQELHIITVRRDGALVGLLPLYVQTLRALRLLPVRMLRNVGTGGDTAPDDLDPLVHRDHTESVSRVLTRSLSLSDPAWDVIRIADVSPDSTFARALELATARSGRRTARAVSAQISFVPLAEGWERFLVGLSSERRANIRRFRRKFESLPGARFFVCSDPAGLDGAIDRLQELHHLRWKGRGEHAFSSAAYTAFHRQVMHACLQRGWLRLYALEVNGEIVAMYYCYQFNGSTFYFQGGFDPTLSKWGLGSVLMGYAIEHAASEGHDRFDMLRGEYEYKRQWAKEVRTTLVVDHYRPTLASLAFRLQAEALPVLKRSLRSIAQLLKGPAVVAARQ